MMSDSQRSHHARHMMSADRYRHWCGDPQLQLDTLRDALGCGGLTPPSGAQVEVRSSSRTLQERQLSCTTRDERTPKGKYKSTNVPKWWGEKGKTSQATKGTNTKSHTQTQECTSEARRRPKAHKQRSNAMRQARDKQHSSSGGRRRNGAATATGRPAKTCSPHQSPHSPPQENPKCMRGLKGHNKQTTELQEERKCSFYHSCRIWCIRTVACKCESVTSVLS